MATAPPDIVREVMIAAPPEVVFPFFTDPEKMVVWKAVDAKLDPRPGGVFWIDVTGHDVARGEYVRSTHHAAWCSRSDGSRRALRSRPARPRSRSR